MADSFISKLISELDSKGAASDTDLVPVADSSGNFFKATWAKLKEWLLGTTDISGIGDGTVTGAVNELNTNMVHIKAYSQSLSGTVAGTSTKSYNCSDLKEKNIIGYIPVVSYNGYDNITCKIGSTTDLSKIAVYLQNPKATALTYGALTLYVLYTG